MRRLRYNVATSLDGFIADRDGGYGWIVHDPTIDFAALFAEFDAFVMGRRTFDTLRAQGAANPLVGQNVLVASRTLRAADHPDVTIAGDDVVATVRDWKAAEGRDIWLFGGGVLARSLFDADLVDSVEVALVPVLLGDGIRLLDDSAVPRPLQLTTHRVLPSGIVMLTYACSAPR